MELVSPSAPVVENFEDEDLEQNSQPVEYREYEGLSSKENELITPPKTKKETVIKVENELYLSLIHI